jgi:hypothetical protein
MAANKKKKEVKVRDLKPSRDAKGGGGARTQSAHFQNQGASRNFGAQSTSHTGTGKLN